MQIALFSDEILPNINGITIHVNELATRLTKKGHHVTVYAPKSIKKTEPLDVPYEITYLQSIPVAVKNNIRFSPPFSFHTFIEMYDNPPDIIHFHTPFTVGFQGIMHAKLFNIPLIGTFHTYFMESEYLRRLGLHKVYLDKNELINKAGWNYANFFYNKADVVISPSQVTKTDLMKNNVKSKVQVISNGIDLSHPDCSHIFDLPVKYFLYVGRLSIEKSIDKVLEAFHKSHLVDESTHLVIVGDGQYRKKLEDIAEKLHIHEKVHFMGMIPNETLLCSNIYRNALAFITASKSEIQPISLLEAMKFDLPIIGVKARGVMELIDGGGFLCEPDDIDCLSNAMTVLATQESKRFHLSKKIHKIVQKHEIDKSIEKIESLYKRLARKKK
jgi:glycosyltransferase involved in cell wall biosynthesis